MTNSQFSINKSILLFTLEYPPQIGGIANYYGNIVKHWSNGSIEVLTGKKLTKPHWLCGLWYLWRAIRKFEVQTVLVGHILPLGTVAWMLQKITKFDYVVFLHGMDLAFALRHNRKKWLAYRILGDAKKVIAVNSYVAKLAGEIVDSGKVVVVNPGVDFRFQISDFRFQNELIEKYNLENKKILLQVGRLVKRKGYDRVLEALPSVLEQIPELIYVIIGDGPELNNIQYSILNIKNNVLILADVGDKELETWYNLCDIFIMPARDIEGDFEGFGIVYLEANLHSKPVIAGDSGGVRDAVVDGLNGLLVNPESIEEIGQAIVKLCKDEELRKRLGRQGRERVLRDFSWKGQTEKLKKEISTRI